MKYNRLIAAGAVLAMAGVAFGDVYDNGPLVSNPGEGFDGADLSMVQSSLGMTTLGFGHQYTANGFRVADDFEVTDGDGWTINTFTGYAYQTDGGIPSTMTGMHLVIWDGDPRDAGSSIVWGDLTVDIMDTTEWMGAYRASENDKLGNRRAIMQSTGTVGVHLDPGVYWCEWGMDGSASSGPWAPPITILGEDSTGDALQNLNGTWQDVLDNGAGTPQGMPFQLDYTVGGSSDCLQMKVSAYVSGGPADWVVCGATPDVEVAIVYGFNPGSTVIKGYAQYCADFGINNVNQNKVVCRKKADGSGCITCRVGSLPAKTGTRILTQAAMKGTCPDPCMSNLDDQVVQ